MRLGGDTQMGGKILGLRDVVQRLDLSGFAVGFFSWEMAVDETDTRVTGNTSDAI